MVYKIIWDFQARDDLRQLHTFLFDKSTTAANRMVSEISKKIRLLTSNPYLAAIEPLLEDKRGTYRSLVVKNYKVVYMIENAMIIIARIWDCRQNTAKLIESLK